MKSRNAERLQLGIENERWCLLFCASAKRHIEISNNKFLRQRLVFGLPPFTFLAVCWRTICVRCDEFQFAVIITRHMLCFADIFSRVRARAHLVSLISVATFDDNGAIDSTSASGSGVPNARVLTGITPLQTPAWHKTRMNHSINQALYQISVCKVGCQLTDATLTTTHARFQSSYAQRVHTSWHSHCSLARAQPL
jgi:hypothetical protein